LGGDHRGLVGLFTFTRLGVVTALYPFPVIYVFTKSMLDIISMEEAASILGASSRPLRGGGRVVNRP